MKHQTITKKYIKALENSLAENRKEIGLKATHDFMEIIETHPDFYSFLISPLINNQDKIDVLQNIKKSLSIEEEVISFLSLLIREKRIGLVSELKHSLDLRYRDITNTVISIIYTAVTINEDMKANILSYLQPHYPDKTISATYRVDPSLIGGFIAHVGEKEYDGSLNSTLEKLRKTIAH